jgi:hypothetical protein
MVDICAGWRHSLGALPARAPNAEERKDDMDWRQAGFLFPFQSNLSQSLA